MEVYELMERNEEPYIIDVKKSKRNPQKVEQQKTTHRKVEQNPSFFGGKKFGSLTGKMSKSPRNQKEEADIYDIILSHLLDEGYADTEQAAQVIMVNMSEDWREEIVEGMDMKDFKANRRNIKRREASADAKSRGHVSKIDVTHGRTYSSDEAKSRRANMSDDERATRKSVAMNPDQVGDTRETSDKTKNPNKLRKQKAMGELG
jgi:hypothetical protein